MLILWLQSCFAKQSPKTSGFFLWIDWLIDGHTCLHFPSRLFSSWGEQGLLSSYGVWAWVLWFLGCRARAQQWWCMWNHLERRLTHVSCIGRLVLYHWATREALECQSLMFPFKFHLVFNTGADIILEPLNLLFVVSLLSHVGLFCNPGFWSPPCFSVHGIIPAGILEWVAISFSRGSSRPRGQTPSVSCIGRRILCRWATREEPKKYSNSFKPCPGRLVQLNKAKSPHRGTAVSFANKQFASCRCNCYNNVVLLYK